MLALIVSLASAGTLVIGEGTTVVLTDIAAGDPNAKLRALVGEVCAVSAGGLGSGGDGWWTGALGCADGKSYTFRQVAVAVVGDAALPRSVTAPAIAAQLGNTIVLPAAGSGSGILGIIGSGTGGLGATTSAPAVATAPSSVAEAPAESLRRPVTPGEPVKLLALNAEDAFYNDRATVVGRLCYPTDTMTLYEGGWHGGPVECWDGASYYFYKVALGVDPTHQPVDPSTFGGVEGGVLGGVIGGAVGGTLGLDPGNIEHGRRVKIVDVSPEDAFYGDRAKLVGKQCTVDGDLHLQTYGEPWYGGGLKCKKDSYYFYKVSVETK